MSPAPASTKASGGIEFHRREARQHPLEESMSSPQPTATSQSNGDSEQGAGIGDP